MFRNTATKQEIVSPPLIDLEDDFPMMSPIAPPYSPITSPPSSPFTYTPSTAERPSSSPPSTGDRPLSTVAQQSPIEVCVYNEVS